MIRFAPRLMVLLLCGTTLAACATTTPDIAKATGGRTAAEAQKAQLEDLGKTPGDVESSVRQAQLLRSAGKYDEAVHILSQLMLVASDDPRVVGEYGKTLAQEGRASEAVQFLSRATELSPADWTIYSAMGVAYDQLGDQDKARTAYQRALVLRPGEASVLNNYALSRMLAGDPDMARQLIARAQSAGGAADPKIARNIALLNQLAPVPAPVAMAQNPAPAQQQAILIPAPPANNIVPTAAPRPLVSQQSLGNIQRPQPQNQAPQYYAPANTVVMQRVPVDPLAGPVAPRPVALHGPRALPVAKAATKSDTAKSDAAKPDTAKPVVAKTADAKPDPKPAAVKVADARPAPVKTADAKPAPAKTDAKPVKTAINTVPALRMAADKY